MDAWATSLISAASGLTGVLIGAWFTGRRERWERKRQMYADILKALANSHTAGQAVALVYRERQESTASSDLYRESIEAAVRAQQVASQTFAIAQIALPSAAVDILRKFNREWEADEGADIGETAANRVRGCERTIDDLISIARKDLGS